MRAQAVLFDKDGTLFDFQKTWGVWLASELELLADGDTALIAKLAEVLHFDPNTSLVGPQSVLVAGTAELAADMMLPFLPDLTRQELIEGGNMRAAMVDPSCVVPLGPFLTGLAEMGLTLGVATNDSESAARKQLGGLGVVEYFDYLVGYDSGHGAKPDPGMCSAFARQTGIDPAQIIMVGDSLHDLYAGRAAGMQVVAVLTGTATADDLRDHADVVLADISELAAWIAA